MVQYQEGKFSENRYKSWNQMTRIVISKNYDFESIKVFIIVTGVPKLTQHK